jgi:formate hydrogenlyase transcriptional activator
VKEFAERMGKPVDRIPKRDLAAMQSYGWPGNVRELRNVVERSLILSRGPELRLVLPEAEGEGSSEASLRLHDVEKAHIEQVLRSTGGQIRGPRGAAEVLGVKASTLYSMMDRLGIERGG